MSKHLEQFVKDNRDDFDKFEPGPVVWNNIEQQLKKPAGQKGILIPINALKWTAAAAVILALGLGVYFIYNNQPKIEVAKVKVETKKTNNLPQVPVRDSAVAKQSIQKQLPIEKLADSKNNAAKKDLTEFDASQDEIAHYTGLIEIKQRQLVKIKNDEPMLYQKFAGDFKKLDSTFHILKKQLPVNPNHEQILEAMIQNLQYQETLLTQQLNIIKKIKKAKKTAYEKAFKTV
jgi:hypothetical protein